MLPSSTGASASSGGGSGGTVTLPAPATQTSVAAAAAAAAHSWYGGVGVPPVLPLSPVGSVATLSTDGLGALLTVDGGASGGGGGGCGGDGGGERADVKPCCGGGSGWERPTGGGGDGGYPPMGVDAAVCSVDGKSRGGGSWNDEYPPMDLGLHRGTWCADPGRPPYC